MKQISVILTLVMAFLIVVLSSRHNVVASAATTNLPVYTADGKLALLANYRDWTFLTSGFGMNYSNGMSSNPMFTNVFVTPEALQGECCQRRTIMTAKCCQIGFSCGGESPLR